MKKTVTSLLLVLTAFFALTVVASASPEIPETHQVGPFDGTFHGVAKGDNGSSAPLTLELTHYGNTVKGTAFLGKGLHVDGGFCGAANIPASVRSASGQTVPNNPRRLAASTAFDVGGFEIGVELDGNVSANGRVLTADAKIDLPWICGGDPVLTTTLYKAS